MTIREWLEKSGLSICEMAKRLGVHHNTLGRIVNGKSRPSITLAKEIEALTFRDVKADSLFGPIQEKPKCPHCGRKMYHKKECV